MRDDFSQRTKDIDIYDPYIEWIKVGKKRSTIWIKSR